MGSVLGVGNILYHRALADTQLERACIFFSRSGRAAAGENCSGGEGAG